MQNMIRNLMVIDDDEDDREIVSSILTEAYPAISLTAATNGQEALQQLRKSALLPDIIFLDVNMPVMNGRQFMQVVKTDEKLQAIPIIVLSTSSDTKTISDLKELGVSRFITKPDKYTGWEKLLQNFFTNSE
jgi:CheY-like chemotaxis protein